MKPSEVGKFSIAWLRRRRSYGAGASARTACHGCSHAGIEFWLRYSVALAILAAPLMAQTTDATPLTVGGKLRFHTLAVVGPAGAVETFAYAGVIHAIGTPREWQLGAKGYGMRAASAFGDTGIRHMMAFGMDAGLKTDPRYFPAVSRNFFARLGHVFASTVVTRTDSGHNTVGVARIVSAVGAATLSDEWYPSRYHNMREGLEQGAIILAFDAGGNLLSEFWPDVKKLFGHKK